VIVIHFMVVGYGGQIYPINNYQLKQLTQVCVAYCGNKPFTVVTVAVATRPNSQLAVIRANYGVTWVSGRMNAYFY
jgi:hypothetical protein